MPALSPAPALVNSRNGAASAQTDIDVTVAADTGTTSSGATAGPGNAGVRFTW